LSIETTTFGDWRPRIGADSAVEAEVALAEVGLDHQLPASELACFAFEELERVAEQNPLGRREGRVAVARALHLPMERRATPVPRLGSRIGRKGTASDLHAALNSLFRVKRTLVTRWLRLNRRFGRGSAASARLACLPRRESHAESEIVALPSGSLESVYTPKAYRGFESRPVRGNWRTIPDLATIARVIL
jgi:hypothetical protein